MERKAILYKPYSEEQRLDFISLQNYKNGYEIRQSDLGLEAWGLSDSELLEKAKAAKLAEACEKAFEYRDKTGVISLNGRPVDTSLLPEDETTLILHTELLNQDDFFQRMSGFESGLFTDDITYNTKEDILIYLNAQETQAIYMAIVNRASKLWNEDYMHYKSLIDNAQTIDEIESIVIDYKGGIAHE